MRTKEKKQNKTNARKYHQFLTFRGSFWPNYKVMLLLLLHCEENFLQLLLRPLNEYCLPENHWINNKTWNINKQSSMPNFHEFTMPGKNSVMDKTPVYLKSFNRHQCNVLLRETSAKLFRYFLQSSFCWFCSSTKGKIPSCNTHFKFKTAIFIPSWRKWVLLQGLAEIIFKIGLLTKILSKKVKKPKKLTKNWLSWMFCNVLQKKKIFCNVLLKNKEI